MTGMTTLSRTHVDFTPAAPARMMEGEFGPLLAASRVMGTTLLAFIVLMSIALL
jgi:hypothetical protein